MKYAHNHKCETISLQTVGKNKKITIEKENFYIKGQNILNIFVHLFCAPSLF